MPEIPEGYQEVIFDSYEEAVKSDQYIDCYRSHTDIFQCNGKWVFYVEIITEDTYWC